MKRLHIATDWLIGHVKQLRTLVFQRTANRELAEELAYHLEREVEENIRRGMGPAEARRAAQLAFGGVERYTEQVREARWTRWLEDVIRDARQSARSLSRSRVFAVTVVLTLALGVGANAALYSLIDALALRTPTGVPVSDRLVRVRSSPRWAGFSHADLRDLQRDVASVLDLAGYDELFVSLGRSGDATRAGAQLVTANYFDVLGVRPSLGRWFMPEEDDVPGREAVAVLSHAMWTTQFAADRDILDGDVLINGHPFRVVGVAPPGFRGLSIEDRADVWLPFMAQPWAMPRSYDVLGDRTAGSVSVVGRLRGDIAASRAETLLSVSAARLPDARRFAPLAPELSHLRGWIEPGSLLDGAALFGFAGVLTGLVLLICCANVAGLQLARSLGRAREIAVRTALGAGRGRIVRMLITESLLLAFVAGGVGVLIGWASSRWLQLHFANDFGGGPFDALTLTPNTHTLLFTFVVAAGAGMTFGLLPALRASRSSLAAGMKGALPGGAGASRARSVLVCGQVAAALVLLVSAGLFLGRLQRIEHVEPGFDPVRYAAFSVDLHAHGYDDAARSAFFDEVRTRLERLPGVQAVAAPTYVPLASGATLLGVGPFDPSSDAAGAAGGSRVPAAAVGVAGNFFSTLEISPVRGRTLGEQDMRAADRYVVVSEPLAARLWGSTNPIGRSIRVGTETGIVDGDTVRVPSHAVVVGTVRPIALGHLADPTDEQVFVPANRHVAFADQGVLVRASGDAAAVLPAVRAEMQRIAGTIPIFDVRTLASDVDDQHGVQRTVTRLVAAFGVLALVLALVGLYGIIASGVAARTREIGVRMALGARGHEIIALFVGGGLRVVAYGILAGSALALAVGRLISSLVWGVRPFEPLVMTGAAILLVLAATAAAWIPARRAARVDPMAVVRVE